METLDLYNLAEKENLKIIEMNFDDLNGLFYNKNIYLNKRIINTKDEKVVLAEELGHYFTGVYPTLPFSTDYYNKLIRSKNEFKAKKWLISKIIPFQTLSYCLEQNMDKYDIADKLDVNESLIDEAGKLYGLL